MVSTDFIYLMFLAIFSGLVSSWIGKFWEVYTFEKPLKKRGINQRGKLFAIRMIFEAILFLFFLLIFYLISQ